MHITAYFTNTFVHLGMFCLQQHYGTLLLVLQQLYLVYPERSHNLQKHSQNNPDVSGGNHNAKINCMNLIVHGNLVHIEGGDNAKHIENQMCTTTFPRVFIVRGFLAFQKIQPSKGNRRERIAPSDTSLNQPSCQSQAARREKPSSCRAFIDLNLNISLYTESTVDPRK